MNDLMQVLYGQAKGCTDKLKSFTFGTAFSEKVMALVFANMLFVIGYQGEECANKGAQAYRRRNSERLKVRVAHPRGLPHVSQINLKAKRVIRRSRFSVDHDFRCEGAICLSRHFNSIACLALLHVERIAQAVPQKIEAERGEENRDTRISRQPGSRSQK